MRTNQTNDHILSLRMPKATRAAIDRLARAERATASEVIRGAIDRRLAEAGRPAKSP